MAVLLPWITQQFFDNNGKPLAGGKVGTYIGGTNSPTAAYADRAGVTPLSNPVELDSSGSAQIWLKPGTYKFVIMDANDVVIRTIDLVSPADGGGGGIIDEDYTFDTWSLRFNEAFSSTGLMDTLEKIIKPGYQAPSVSLSGSSNVLREKGDTVAAVTLTAAITKKSSNIAEVRFYRGATLLDTQISGGGIPTGGNSTYNESTPFSDTTTFSVQVDDASAEAKPSATSSATYTFVYPYFWGGDASGALTAANVAAKTKDIRASSSSVARTYTASGATYCYFAQPSSYPAITKIYDINNFDVTAAFTSFTGTYTALDGSTQTLRVYKTISPVGADTYFRFER